MMKALLKDALVYDNGSMKKQDMIFDGSSVCACTDADTAASPVIFNTVILPGFCDVHVHLREPGFSYKETIKTGTLACAHGGYTAVCSMPNLKPAPDTLENFRVQTDIIKKDACIAVYPYATITRMQMGLELSDMEALSRECIAFSDDGRGVQDDEMMLSAMQKARSLGKMIVAHCEDNSLLFGGYIHDGEYAKAHGHKGISSESEWRQIERDLALVERTKCKYHVCHVSTKESVALIRDAKKRGLDVSCETAPHYLILDDSCMQEDARFKMNPPLRSKEDRDAMIEALLDGTIDMIATDHAPHSAEEKAKGLADSAMGVVGIESAFSLMYTHFVRTGVITLERLVELMSKNPRVRFGIDSDVGFTVFETATEFTLDPDKFLSKGRATPFAGERLFGRCLATVYNGKVVFAAE